MNRSALDQMVARLILEADWMERPVMATVAVNVQFEQHDVYIGRGKGDRIGRTILNNPYRGLFGNPFAIGADGTRDEVIRKYKDWVLHSPEAAEVRRRMPELKGKRLGCHCAPLACHGDVIAMIVEGL